jgi:hypothetical protein
VVVALPGLAVALLFLRLRDYPTVRLDGPAGARSARRIVGELFRARSGTAAYMGGAVQLMVVSTLYTCGPHWKLTRQRMGKRVAIPRLCNSGRGRSSTRSAYPSTKCLAANRRRQLQTRYGRTQR